MHKKRYKIFIIIFAFILIFVLLFNLFLGRNAKTIITNNLIATAEVSFIDISNKAMEKVLNRCNISYEDIANIKQDSDGNIIAITCDTFKLIKVKNILDNTLVTYLNKEPPLNFSIPIGNFFKNEFLAGRGPKLKFNFTYDSITFVKFKSTFISKGINQTLHKIIVTLSTDISMVIPWYCAKTKVNTSYVVAETLIVGKVPNNFTDINFDDLNGKITS